MRTLIDKEQFESALVSYRGADAQIWLFSITHKRLVVRLSFTNQNEVLYILAVSCEYMKGPFSWSNANILFMDSNTLAASEFYIKIIDKDKDFELISSGGVVLSYGLKDDPWLSFDDPL
ncbi:hypothetical protein ACDQ55_18945 [Chitinophaga sp. 30R24]|uniref:hypothetical protein n=1 Tax=Chitinophaga sp. 30R24 TaxID=3248838 RepID=UPI003B8F84B5